jgi:DNA-binding SARP family transcriptional activator
MAPTQRRPVVDSASLPCPPPLSISVLDGFELRHGSRLLVLPQNAQRVLAFLAVRERPQLRATVAASLWLDVNQRRASANLRTALWRIRQSAEEVVLGIGTYLGLAPGTDVDLARLLHQARRLIRSDDLLDPRDAVGDGLCGELLPEWDDDWIQYERERLRQLRVHALEALCCRLSVAGRHAEAVDAGQLAVATEPLRESAQRVLIRAHLTEGNTCEAQRQFGLYRNLLWDALQTRPSPDISAMIRDARRPRRPAEATNR